MRCRIYDVNRYSLIVYVRLLSSVILLCHVSPQYLLKKYRLCILLQIIMILDTIFSLKLITLAVFAHSLSKNTRSGISAQFVGLYRVVAICRLRRNCRVLPSQVLRLVVHLFEELLEKVIWFTWCWLVGVLVL